MNIAQGDRARLVEEIDFVVAQMEAEADPFRQLYLFSGIFGEMQRILNLTWDSELALLYMAIRSLHTATNERLYAIAQGRDRGIRLPDSFMGALIEATKYLAQALKNPRMENTETYRLLVWLAELTYLTTGNGYYLYIKGRLKPREIKRMTAT